jgi:hypothetical protein
MRNAEATCWLGGLAKPRGASYDGQVCRRGLTRPRPTTAAAACTAIEVGLLRSGSAGLHAKRLGSRDDLTSNRRAVRLGAILRRSILTYLLI